MAPVPLQTKRRTRINASGRIETAQADVAHVDVASLARDLARETGAEVRFDDGARALYSTDASNYRQTPIGVVVPRSMDDVRAAVAACRRHGAPILARGGATSLAGECANTAVVIDFSKYLNRVLEIDADERSARTEPGCILDSLRCAAKAHGLTFGPDPATHSRNTIGGMIGNNSGGVHTLTNGITANNVERLHVLTYEGLELDVGPTSSDDLRSILAAGGKRAEIYRALDRLRREYADDIRRRFPDIPRRVSGFENLDCLLPEKGFDVARALVGSEGTCVIVLEAKLTLIPRPPARALALIGFPDICAAADRVPDVLEYGPIALEGFDDALIERYREKGQRQDEIELLPRGRAWLLAEAAGADEDAARAGACAIADAFARRDGADAKVISDPAEQARIWAVREGSLGAESYAPNHPDAWPGWEDSAVHPRELGAYLRGLRALFGRYGYDPVIYGHFGDGVVHCAVPFDLYDEPGVATWRRFLDEAAGLVVSHGGSLSGEHGDGQARGALLEKMYGPRLVRAFREFKAIWDPRNRMNPGKVVDPFPITSNLRVGPEYRPPKLETHFAYPDDHGAFARAAQRCVGVGACRRLDPGGDVMCPSFMATREERHSTRGRARLLFEMLHGGAIDDGWRNRAVEEALSLCLACKGCKKDCPVNVDMATYKAEFRAHHYAGRLRPRSAYATALIFEWAKIASIAPGFANGMFGARAIRWAAGLAPDRPLPRFSRQAFRSWFKRRTQRDGGEPVLLWPDTFNNFFRPETAIAATCVLEQAGFRVVIPDRPLCCGRPLYDWGFLDRAKRQWRAVFGELKQALEENLPVVVLEPACASAFKDELPALFPGHDDAQRLSANAVLFADFLRERGALSGLQGGVEKVLLHFHCHQHAVLGKEAERALLSDLDYDCELVSAGCCGMAGAFGYEAHSANVSQAIGERGVLARVRVTPMDRLVVADGFSCREQIEHGAGRHTLHVAELLARRLPSASLGGVHLP